MYSVCSNFAGKDCAEAAPAQYAPDLELEPVHLDIDFDLPNSLVRDAQGRLVVGVGALAGHISDAGVRVLIGVTPNGCVLGYVSAPRRVTCETGEPGSADAVEGVSAGGGIGEAVRRSHNPPVVGSIPTPPTTRPTSSDLGLSVFAPDIV